ncbi:MAG TPA: hypothetical protein VNO26_08295 [Candidatus Limnocylindria bacterium]|nr:hypothetical protein [Candidatus Limnocylindria bacterium]
MDVRLQLRARRIARTVLFAVSRIGLWWVLALVLLSVDPPVTPPLLFRLMLVLVVLPGLAAAVLRGRPATAAIKEGMLVLSQGRTRLEVPCEAIAGLRSSPVPLPDVGLVLLLRSGRRIVPGLESDDPAPLLDALAAAGAAPAAATRRRPAVVMAAARSQVRRRWWDHPLVKFGLVALLPAGVLFNVHQHISFGGFWGEYYTYGARAWLRTLGVYYAATVIYCVLWASVWRGLGEGAALAAAAVAPTHAAWVRRAVETICRLAYYAGVPILLLIRFLP